MADAQITVMNGISFGTVPCNGPRAVPFKANFNLASQYDFNFTAAQQGGQIDSVQTVYVDNSANTAALTLTIDGTQQSIVIPPNSCAYLPIVAPLATVIHATTTGLVTVYLAFLNFYIPPTVWSAI